MRAVLKRCLTDEDYTQLEAVSQGWSDSPFRFDPATRRFEVSESWLFAFSGDEGASPGGEDPFAAGEDAVESGDEAGVPDELDAILRACEVLGDHLDELEAAGGLPVETPESGEITLTYDFEADPPGPGAEELEVARRFLSLLRQHEAFRVHDQLLGATRRVEVRFEYTSDFDYGVKKSQADWLLDLARRLQQGRPYGATRV